MREVEENYREWMARSEAGRCRRCGSCHECHVCLPGCSSGNVYLEVGGMGTILQVPESFPEDLSGGWAIGSHDGRTAQVRLLNLVPHVDANTCIACGRCEEVCPYHAVRVEFVKGWGPRSSISREACRACGACQGTCPTGAITQAPFAIDAIVKMVGEAVKHGAGAVGIRCWWGAGGTDTGGGIGDGILDVSSLGGIGPGHLARALMAGARGILLLQCPPDYIHFLQGEARPEELARRFARFLEAAGLAPMRISFVRMRPGDDARELLRDYVRELDSLGVEPLSTEEFGDLPNELSPFAAALALSGQPDINLDPWFGPLPLVLDALGRAFGTGHLGPWARSLEELRRMTGERDPDDVMDAALRLVQTLGERAGEAEGGSALSRVWGAGGDDGIPEAPEVDEKRWHPGGEGRPRVAVHSCGGGEPLLKEMLEDLLGVDIIELDEMFGGAQEMGWSSPEGRSREGAIGLLRAAHDAGARSLLVGDPMCLSFISAVTGQGAWREYDVEVIDPLTFVLSRLRSRGAKERRDWPGEIWGIGDGSGGGPDGGGEWHG
jgi:ferredoxin/coenzyme F420-reducing hydrogenase delta subunit